MCNHLQWHDIRMSVLRIIWNGSTFVKIVFHNIMDKQRKKNRREKRHRFLARINNTWNMVVVFHFAQTHTHTQHSSKKFLTKIERMHEHRKKSVKWQKTNGTNEQKQQRQKREKKNSQNRMHLISCTLFIRRLIYFIQMILLFNQKHTSILRCIAAGLCYNILLESLGQTE